MSQCISVYLVYMIHVHLFRYIAYFHTLEAHMFHSECSSASITNFTQELKQTQVILGKILKAIERECLGKTFFNNTDLS